jgi:hypothetical protein
MFKQPLDVMIGLKRVRLVQRIGIVEARRLIEQKIDEPKYHPHLIKYSTQISCSSNLIFTNDEIGLAYVVEKLLSQQVVTTEKAGQALSDMLAGLYSDRDVFKTFEKTIKPFFDLSPYLEESTIAARMKADSAKKYGEKIEILSGIQVPKPNNITRL